MILPNKKLTAKILIIFFFFVFFQISIPKVQAVATPLTAQPTTAAPTPSNTYTPLQNVNLPNGKPLYTPSIITYLQTIYSFGIAIAGALAVIMIVFGGIQYMLSDAFTSKSDAKDKIWAALQGLLLALCSYVLLYTINPEIVKLKFDLKPVAAPSATGVAGTSGVSNGVTATPGTGSGGKVAFTGTDGSSINPNLTAYSPQAGGSSMEGGYKSSVAGLDGQSIVRTLDDVANGSSNYVTLAGDPSQYGKTYIIPEITYTNSAGVTQTLHNVTGYVHDTGSAFTGAGTSKFDIPIGKNYNDTQMASQPFSK